MINIPSPGLNESFTDFIVISPDPVVIPIANTSDARAFACLRSIE